MPKLSCIWRVFVQLVQDHFGVLAALQFDHRAHAGLVRFVADLGDAFDALLAHHLADLHQQGGLVHLVRQLVDDDGLTVALADVLEVGARAHHHTAAAGAVAFLHAGQTVDETGGREVGCGHDLDQLLDVHVRILQQRQTGIHHFAHVVRRDVGRHAHRDTGGTVHQQVGEARREHQRLVLGTVVVRPEIHGLFVQIGQQFMRDLRHADFGVTHRRRVIAVHRTEVTLTVHQRVAQREILRHAHDGVVHRRVAVRVVLTDHIADDTRRFLVGLVPVVGQLVHREQHAPVHRLQTVAHIGQRTAYDHTHRVVQIGLAHLFFKADWQGFFGELLFHERPINEPRKEGYGALKRSPHSSTAPFSHRLPARPPSS